MQAETRLGRPGRSASRRPRSSLPPSAASRMAQANLVRFNDIAGEAQLLRPARRGGDQSARCGSGETVVPGLQNRPAASS